MKRISLAPRENWQQRLEAAGCFYHTIDGVPYWQEEAAYVFKAEEIDCIEAAAQQLHDMCMEHVDETVARGDYQGYNFSDEVKAIIQRSCGDQKHLFGRFDLGYDGRAIKLFEYNADTPTALPEASIWQHHAREDRGWPDQFNSIHEELLARWKELLGRDRAFQHVHFSASAEGRHEDFGNLHYMMEVAHEAGLGHGTSIDIEAIGWDGFGYVDERVQPIKTLFKLYPWEWMLMEDHGWKVKQSNTRFIEPAWKLLLSTKAILPLLWQRYPNHPLLLEAHFEDAAPHDKKRWVRKPTLGREGANITLQTPAHIAATGAFSGWVRTNPAVQLEQYDRDGYVLQEHFRVPPCGTHVPVLGAWVVGDKACGLGVREDPVVNPVHVTNPISSNGSMFVPHYFEE